MWIERCSRSRSQGDVPGRVFETREPERFDRISDVTRDSSRSGSAGTGIAAGRAAARAGRSIGVLVFSRAEAPSRARTRPAADLRLAARWRSIPRAVQSRAHSLGSAGEHLRHVPSSGAWRRAACISRRVRGRESWATIDLFSAPDGRVVAAIGCLRKGVTAHQDIDAQ